jgi:uncharacterized protein (UPF0332 family)
VSGTVAPLARAEEELGAARALRDAGFPAQAVGCAARAALQSARAALLAAGEAPATDAGVVGAFTRRLVVAGALDPEHGALLRRLLEDRDDVDRVLATAPASVADAAIADAARLVAALSAR